MNILAAISVLYANMYVVCGMPTTKARHCEYGCMVTSALHPNSCLICYKDKQEIDFWMSTKPFMRRGRTNIVKLTPNVVMFSNKRYNYTFAYPFMPKRKEDTCEYWKNICIGNCNMKPNEIETATFPNTIEKCEAACRVEWTCKFEKPYRRNQY